MSDTIARELERLDKRIAALQAERRVLVRLQRANGGAVRRKRAAGLEIGAPRQAEAGYRPRDGTAVAVVLTHVKRAAPNGIRTDGVVGAMPDQAPGTIHTSLHYLKTKGAIRQEPDGRWVVA